MVETGLSAFGWLAYVGKREVLASQLSIGDLRTALPTGLQFPGADDGIFDGICISVPEVGDHHHVLDVAPWYRERLRERLEQEIPGVEHARITT